MKQDKGPEFYKQFGIIVCGVDNVGARRWINSYVHGMLRYDCDESMKNEDEEEEEAEEPLLDPSSVVFLVDSGTEGFKGFFFFSLSLVDSSHAFVWPGNIRVVTPGISSCIDCNVELFPPEVKVPLCTIAATPRNAAHCIQYAGLIAWNEQAPFKGEC